MRSWDRDMPELSMGNCSSTALGSPRVLIEFVKLAKTGTEYGKHAYLSCTYLRSYKPYMTYPGPFVVSHDPFWSLHNKTVAVERLKHPLCCSRGQELGRRSRLVVDRFVSSCLSSSTFKSAWSARHCFLSPPGCSEHVDALLGCLT